MRGGEKEELIAADEQPAKGMVEEREFADFLMGIAGVVEGNVFEKKKKRKKREGKRKIREEKRQVGPAKGLPIGGAVEEEGVADLAGSFGVPMMGIDEGVCRGKRRNKKEKKERVGSDGDQVDVSSLVREEPTFAAHVELAAIEVEQGTLGGKEKRKKKTGKRGEEREEGEGIGATYFVREEIGFAEFVEGTTKVVKDNISGKRRKHQKEKETE